MKITTMITLPEEVYQYYRNTAALRGNTTTEQIIAETLSRCALPEEDQQPGNQ